MSLVDYTTYDDIRGVLGVSDDELEDSTLSLEVWETGLTMELLEVSSALPAFYTVVSKKSEDARSAAEQWFYSVTRLFTPYAVGRQLSTALPMFGPKDVTDGKASINRFADSPYRETIKRVQEGYDRYRKTLAKAYEDANATVGASTTMNWFAVSSPSTDPVTGS